MRTGAVSSVELYRAGRRLNGGYFLSEDELAMRQLRSWSGKTDSLKSLSQTKGIFSGGIFRMVEAKNSEYGLPYVSAKDLVKIDVQTDRYLSFSHGTLLQTLSLRENTILVTCSGMNLGRAIWVRRDMDGLCGSGDLIRIVPSKSFDSPGYIYAFLASKFGWVSLRQLIFGGNIKHIEPKAVSQILVPRIDKKREKQCNGLVLSASQKRTSALTMQKNAVETVNDYLGAKNIKSDHCHNVVSALEIGRRLDAFHHRSSVREARAILAENGVELGEKVISVYEPNRGARRRVRSNGIPFISSAAVFRSTPNAEYEISRKTPGLHDLIVTERDCLIPRSGQVGGIIGRAVLPLPYYYGWAASEHLVRVRCKSREDAFCVWCVLSSKAGYIATVGTAFGSSIPSLDCDLLSKLKIPWIQGSMRQSLVDRIDEATSLLTSAISDEQQAISIVEQAIEENS